MNETQNQVAVVQEVPQREMSLADVVHRNQLIKQVLEEVMVRDHHYGSLPGVKGMVLFKAGAEKLAVVFRLAPSFGVQRNDLPNGHREYIVTCTMIHAQTGTTLGSGVGSASTMETKYRYRWKGEGRMRARVENPDIADQYNTVLKMAKKRAQVDATLTVTGASDIFAPDDEGDEEKHEAPQPTEREQLLRSCNDLCKQLGGDAKRIGEVLAEAGLPTGIAMRDRNDADLRRVMEALAAAINSPKQSGFVSWWLLTMIALVLTIGRACSQDIVVDNLASKPQSSWVFCALPASAMPEQHSGYMLVDGDKGKARWVAGDGGVRIQMLETPPGRHRLAWGEKDEAPPFRYAAGLSVMDLIPTWTVDGVPSEQDLIIQITESDEAHVRWVMRSRHPATQWSHELWFDVFSDQTTVEWVSESTFGTTANGAPQDYVRLVPDLRMQVGVPMHRDHGVRVRLPANERIGDRRWSLVLAEPGAKMHRTARIENRGAFLARPDPARLEGRRMWAVWSGWAKSGEWPPYGKVPDRPLNWKQDLAAALDDYLNPRPVGYWASRPDVQPRWSETTGEQPGFGASTCGRVVTLGEPWGIDYLLWCCQAYAYRPSAFREPSGLPMRAVDHPLAETIDGIMWRGWSQGDRMGWSENVAPTDFPVDWSNDFPSRSEAQHRDGTTMCLAYMLSKDPGLRSVIEDNVQLALLDGTLARGWIQAPRAIGRVLLERSLMAMVGFPEIKPQIVRHLDLIERASYFSSHPAAQVFVVGPVGIAVFGWRDANGWEIAGPPTWQQSIAITQGLMPAHIVTGDHRALDWAMRAARTTVDIGFRQVNGRWAHTYAWAIRDGQIPPDAKFDGGTNDWVTMNPAADYWSAAACELLASREPDTLLGKRAGAVLQQFGAPHHWQESQWRCVR